MKSNDVFIAVTTALSGVLVCVATAAQPAETKDADVLVTQSERMNSLTRTHGSATVSSTISSDFSGFAGSTANAEALATGLRSGTAITLTSTDAKGVTTATTFTPPTGRMGFGNVFISLALARQQLAGLGITDPSAQQIQAALVGGKVTGANGQTTTLAGVLTLRARRMGWGQIAHTLGFKLGPVISEMKAANAHMRSQSVAGSGTVGAAGMAAGPGAGHEENASGRGIVTAAGTPAAASHGNAFGRGIVTGTGAPTGQAAPHGRSAGKGN